MDTIIFIIIGIILSVSIIFIFFRGKPACPECKSHNIIPTGKKIYKEDPPIAFWGSPDSTAELEYKCTDCGNVFGVKRKLMIFN